MAMEQRRYRLPPFGSSAPLIPFTSFPDPLTVEGQVRRPAELPRVSLIALGGLWRPLGGRQVLAMRTLNPVTVQSLAAAVAETIGPFPGGLVRAGMQVQMRLAFKNSAVGTGGRLIRLYAGPVGAATSTGQIAYWNGSVNSNYAEGELLSRIDVQSNGSANHVANPSSASSSLVLAGGYQTQVATPTTLNPLVNFSAPWEIAVFMQSCAETATTITSATWSAGVATFTNTAHTLNTGDKTTVAGVTPSGYNGVYTGVTRIDANTWSGTLVADPGAYTSGGTSSRISNMISQSYVLELVG